MLLRKKHNREGTANLVKMGDRAVIQVGMDSVAVPLNPKHFKNSGKDGFHGFKLIALDGNVYRCQVMLFKQ